MLAVLLLLENRSFTVMQNFLVSVILLESKLSKYYCFAFLRTFVQLFLCFLSQPAYTYSKLTIETPEQGVKYVQSWRRSSIFVVNFERISHLVLVFLFLTLNM